MNISIIKMNILVNQINIPGNKLTFCVGSRLIVGQDFCWIEAYKFYAL